MILLLARHAAHRGAGQVLSGRTDETGLTEVGRAQAAALTARLLARPPSMLVASPRRRARETAAIVATSLKRPVDVADALDELDYGEWTGREIASLAAEPAWRCWNEQRGVGRPPGGEAMHEAQSRILRWIEALPQGGPVLAISHGDVIKAALAAFLGLSLDAHQRFDIAPASLSAIELWPGGGRVLWMNLLAEAA
ncbi:histidine phosphatase family protein [Falsiroseomonas sp. HW251]|uniref:histidine phosphatase family protein n=1 Tax=Falsiroseomonas sp. HW251 TaxID=3390998 RepID=UPI003D323110